MRRRHLRQVLRIEGQVYPRPWSAALFLQEIVRKSDRIYLVAKSEGVVVGYVGSMITGSEAHITTIAVDPEYQRRKIGMRLMIAAIEAALDRSCSSISLEVRKSNLGAQQMYERFGFRPVGVRRGYYIETGEDAIVMWAEKVDSPRYAQLLDEIRRSLPRASSDG
jgi:ribosomal-protein-alanine N-acetyltransferase